MHRLYIFLVAFLSIACGKDWFDVKSINNQAIPETLNDLQALLDNGSVFNIYGPFMAENASGEHYFTPEIVSQLAGVEKNSYLWDKEEPNLNVSDWTITGTGSYVRIYYSNLILEQVKKIKTSAPDDELHRLRIFGQALFLRAKTFFELAQTFAPYPETGNENLKLGVALRVESDINAKSLRSTVKETYDQIISDLIEATNYLPKSEIYRTRATSTACYALLARVYLSIGKYDEAKKSAGEALKVSNKLIDFETLDYLASDNPFHGYNEETLFYSQMGGANYFQPSTVLIPQDLYDLYEENDLRKFVYFNNVDSVITFKGTYCGSGFDLFFNGLAIDELYLIRAECYARSGEVNLALKDLNTLLRNRWLGEYVDINARNAEEALKLILIERRKELLFRGVRWSDLRRLNKDSRFVKTLSRVADGKTYVLEPNSYKYTFPIPDDIIQFNGMQQNPGW